MSSQGRVELFYNGTWGTVCSNNWKLRDANVVCHQLGFGGAQSVYIQTVFGRRKGNSWYYDLRCIGNESSLTNCGQSVWFSSYCSHSSDADVVCRTGTKCYKTVNLLKIIFYHFAKNFIICKKLSTYRKTNKQTKKKTVSCFYSVYQLVWWKDGNPPEKD